MEREVYNFLNYLEVEKNYSKYTILNYERDINEFVFFLKKETIVNFKEVDYKLLRLYLNEMFNRQYSSKTVSRNLSSLRTFFKFLLKSGIITNNPMILISNPKEEKKLPSNLNNFLSFPELKLTISIVTVFHNGFKVSFLTLLV